ncbi:J domain-containing protein [Halocatena pleomorpha]|uniref:J domain-containing protein n=1 Tax=Halocatena pleomorpha TaxID=1785090 RepID=A0A3P3RAS8_9EURY|nr:J domain-containing protein [Halocatena pleomorpha]RRJ30504.1 J domain-containing protein [Halocatena pleomorpha]
MTESYYELLDVSPNASESEIRKAYREQVKRHHPDVSDEPDARQKIIQIREAKEVLTDEEQRSAYDRKRATGNRRRTAETRDASASPNSSGDRHERGSENDRWWTRTRANRWTRTRTHERERTASTERVDPTLGEQIEWVADRFRETTALFVRAITEPPPNPVPFVQKWLEGKVQSPTAIRLVFAALLVLTFTQSLPSVVDGYSQNDPMFGLGIVLGSLFISYTGYELVSPLPFEPPRQRERYKPAGKLRLWPIIGANLVSLLMIAFGHAMGAVNGGIGFALASVVVFGVFFVVVPSVFGNGLRLLVGGDEDVTKHTTWVGVGLGVFTAIGVLFTPVGGETFQRLISLVGEPTPAPWVDPLLLGPIRMGTLLNFLLGMTLISGLLWSSVAMCRDLTAAPWSDRYDHGYRVRPAVWNAVLAAPFAVFAWMIGSGIHRIPLQLPFSTTLTITRNGMITVIVLLPTVLTGVYILRRRAEPLLRERLYGRQ